MTVAGALLLVLAGIGGGLAGSVAGLASLVSYPALLAAGLGPIQANVTNTVALVFSSLGSITGSRLELRGQSPAVRRLAVAAVLGGAAGGALLLVTDPRTFELAAPWLIGLSALSIPLQERVWPIRAAAAAGTAAAAATATASPAVGLDVDVDVDGPPRTPATRAAPSPALTAGVFTVGIYGGYFGAGAGVVMLALLLAAGDTLARTNALRNVLVGAANATAAVGFCLLADVHWASIAPLAVGLYAGARLGPVIVRRADARILRAVIAVLGAGLAVKLGLDAYA